MKRLLKKITAPQIGLAAAAIILVLYIIKPAFLNVIELKTLDHRFQIRGRTDPGREAAIIAIDDRSIEKLGRWPWPRRYIAQAVRNLKDAGAKVIGFDILFTEPDRNTSLEALERIKDAYLSTQAGRTPSEGALFAGIIDEEMKKWDNDTALAEAIAGAGNVILPMYFTLPGEKGEPITDEKLKAKRKLLDRSAYALVKQGLSDPRFLPPAAVDVTNTIEKLNAGALCEGTVNIIPDADGALRRELLVVGLKGDYYPSLTLQMARAYMGIDLSRTKLTTSDSIELGASTVPLSLDNKLLINYCGPNETFPYISFIDVLDGTVPPERIRGKIVILGAVAAGLGDLKITPFSPLLPGVEKHANVLQNILHNNFLKRNITCIFIDVLLILGLGLLLGFTLSRLSTIKSVFVFTGTLLCFFGISQLLFTHFNLVTSGVYPLLAIILAYTCITAFKLLTEEREKKKIRDIFSHYAAEQVVNQLLANPESVKLGGEKRKITVLFADIENFTVMSEILDPQEVAALLNKYLTAMTKIVFKHGGTVDKFMGDAIMVLFSAPLAFPDHAHRACLVALDMLKVIHELQEEWTAKTGHRLNIRVGINTGEVVVGNMGSEELMDYTAIGDAVNLTQRLEQVNKEYGTNIIIGEATYNEIKDTAVVRQLGKVKVKGKNIEVTIFELKGLKK
jgi:adenylate cyclase